MASPEGSLAGEEQGERFRMTAVREANFTVEEVVDDPMCSDSNIEVVRPDHYEEADSEVENDEHTSGPAKDDETKRSAGIIHGLRNLHCDGDDIDSQEERERIYMRKKKRWSAGVFKRSHSQSIGSTTDIDVDVDEEALDAQDVARSARRLRRRVRGPSERASLTSDDVSGKSVAESEGPVDSSPARPATSSDLDDDILPFWIVEDFMELDSDSG